MLAADDSALAPQRLLNRAIPSSLADAAFLAEADRLARAQPDALLRRLLTSASLDVQQVDLMCGLLHRTRALLGHCPAGEETPLALGWLRELLGGAAELPGPRREALLLLLARLAERRRRPAGGEDDARAPDAAETGEAAAAADDDAPLLSRGALLAHVVLPQLVVGRGAGADAGPSAAASEARLSLALQAALQLLSGAALRVGAQQVGAQAAPSAATDALGDAALASLLGALLELVAARGALGEECCQHLLRCAQGAVQLLLPRATAAAAAPGAWLASAAARWEALPWRAKLQAWPLSDRLRRRAAGGGAGGGAAGGGAGGAGGRLLRWLRAEARCGGALARELQCVAFAAAVPGVPAKQALSLLLDERQPTAASDAPRVLAALATALPRGTLAEWQLISSQLLPPLDARGLLPPPAPPSAAAPPAPPPPPPPAVEWPAEPAERLLCASAHALLAAFLFHRALPGARAAERGCFATALGKWLVAAAAESPAPLAAAHLLGVALRSLRDAPGHAGERLYIACLQLLTRLLDAGPAPHAEGIARRAVEGARLPAGREAGLLAVLAARARE